MPPSEPHRVPDRFLDLTLALIFGLAVLLLLSLVPLGFPIGRPETALALFPKLQANVVCVESLREAAVRDVYVLRYANFAVWSCAWGVLLGMNVRRTIPGMRGVVVPAGQKPVSPVAPRTRRQRLTGLLLLVGFFGVLCVLLPWWIVFHASACMALGAGLPEYRAFQGVVPAVLLAGPGVLAGVALERLWRGLVQVGCKMRGPT